MTTLSKTICKKIDEWIGRYPPEQKRSGVFEALRLVQEENGGYLTIPLMDAVADYLEMPRVSVYEIVSFYSLYFAEPVGRHIVDVCTNISCWLNNAESILMHIKNRFNIDINETSADKKITLRAVECLGACTGAPVCQIGKKYYEHLTPEKMDQILGELD